MKKRSGDIPENGLNDVVILLHSEGQSEEKGFWRHTGKKLE